MTFHVQTGNNMLGSMQSQPLMVMHNKKMIDALPGMRQLRLRPDSMAAAALYILGDADLVLIISNTARAGLDQKR